MLRLNLWSYPVLFVARDPWVQPAPGFPCALTSMRGWKVKQTSGAMRRENADSYLRTILNRHAAETGIQ